MREKEKERGRNFAGKLGRYKKLIAFRVLTRAQIVGSAR